MKKIILFYAENPADTNLITELQKNFENSDILFMEIGEDSNFFYDSDFNKKENQPYLENCRLAIIDPRPQCCTMTLPDCLALIVKRKNPLNTVMAITQEKTQNTNSFDTFFITDGKICENEEFIFEKLTEWFT